jgi:FkbM family methyltransferase
MRRISEIIEHIGLIFSKRHLTRRKRLALLRAYCAITGKRFLRRFAGGVLNYKQQRFLGFTVALDRFESLYWIFIEIFVNENYFFKTDTKTPFVIDCGSNIGLSVLYFKFLYPDSKVLAFEPHPDSAATLRKNIERNGLKDVTVVEGALGLTEGELTLATDVSSTSATVYGDFLKRQESIRRRGVEETNFRKEMRVRAYQLSPYIKETVHFLKLDVEGAEADILQELDRSGAMKYIKELAMEYHQFSQETNRLSIIADVLERSSYDFLCAGEFNNFASAPKRDYKTFMIFARKRHV